MFISSIARIDYYKYINIYYIYLNMYMYLPKNHQVVTLHISKMKNSRSSPRNIKETEMSREEFEISFSHTVLGTQPNSLVLILQREVYAHGFLLTSKGCCKVTRKLSFFLGLSTYMSLEPKCQKESVEMIQIYTRENVYRVRLLLVSKSHLCTF